MEIDKNQYAQDFRGVETELSVVVEAVEITRIHSV